MPDDERQAKKSSVENTEKSEEFSGSVFAPIPKTVMDRFLFAVAIGSIILVFALVVFGARFATTVVTDYVKGWEISVAIDTVRYMFDNPFLDERSKSDNVAEKTRVLTYLEHNEQGLIYMEAGEYEEAEEMFLKSIELNPDYIRPYNNLGKVYSALGLPDEAEKYWKKVLVMDPQYMKGYNNLGALYVEMEKYELAMEHLITARDLDPNSYYPHQNLGRLYRDIGETEKAHEEYSLALSLGAVDAKGIKEEINLLTWETYINEDYAFSIRYPDGWEVLEQPEPTQGSSFEVNFNQDPSASDIHGSFTLRVHNFADAKAGKGSTVNHLSLQRDINRKFEDAEYDGDAEIVMDVKGLSGYTASIFSVTVDTSKHQGLKWYFVEVTAPTPKGFNTYVMSNDHPEVYEDFELFYKTLVFEVEGSNTDETY